MAAFARTLRHLFAPSAAGSFPDPALARIGEAIAAGERLHDGEVVFAVEAGLPAGEAWRGAAPRARAEDVFARLRVWDTRADNGVLLYLLLADHAIEIVADRGLHGRVTGAEWEAVCAAVRERLLAGDDEAAAVEGVARISALLAAHFPATGEARDELPDRPVRL
ncbi:TPM domain-containing protein [Pseudoxanthomonas sp.]|uniref:TPM domain-containing protein n=1 Tax=Pseudoxanthomonas sp. TaxID=1871049 RepID=UPI0025858C36|nr:TPM domain-containing protein [Pseudoxanthomonas sp.]MCR6685499.1 TPM domain-containing protein [Pseudoxanthomonas sp.]